MRLWKSGTSSKRDHSARKTFKLKQLFCIFVGSLLFLKNRPDSGENQMLIISRKKDEKIIVADDIEITILEVGRNRVRFGIKAPRDVAIQTRLKTTPEVTPEALKEVTGLSAAVEAPRQDILQREMSAGANSSKTS